jgi:hypothetical protein
MPYAPGHLQQVRRRRYRSRRELLAVRVAALIAVALIGLVVYSLTTQRARVGNGCIDFNYSTMIGGSEAHRCGASARKLCATPPARKSIDGDYQSELYAACRRAHIPTSGT